MEPNFLEGLIFLLIGLLFFKETILKWLGKAFGFKNGEDKIPTWAQDLKSHYNHETTELLKEIRNSQDGSCKKLDRVINMLENQDKYGIKIRQ